MIEVAGFHNDYIRFQRFYLETVIPIAACSLSLVWIIYRSSRAWLQRGKKTDFHPLIDVEEEEDLTLQRSKTRHSIVDVDKPRGEASLVSIEVLLLLGQVAIGLAFVITVRPRQLPSSVAILAVWVYVAVLGLMRLYSTHSHGVFSHLTLWNHTALLYTLQWLSEAFIFRSAIIHPRSSLSQKLIIAQFSLTSALLLIALLSRRGNSAVNLEYEGDIEPPREPLASILSTLTFSWADALIYKGFKKPLELEDVWNVMIQDKAEYVIDTFRQIKKTHTLAIRLILHFKKELLLQGAWCAISSVLMFMPTLLLKSILEYLQEPESVSPHLAWLQVIFLFVTGILQSVADGQALWTGRKICIRLRGVIVGEIYSKVLRRKATATTENEKAEETSTKKKKLWERIKSWGRMDFTSTSARPPPPNRPVVDLQANNGTVINLMSIDSFKVSDISSYWHFLWAATPVQLAMAVGLLYKVLGFSSFAGIILMILVLPLNMWIAKSFQRAQKKIMAATDARIHVTNEVLSNIRIIKYFAWESRFEQNVDEKRKVELDALWKKYILWSFAATVWSGVPILITFTSFFIYTTIEKQPLVPSIAFPALSMFSLLRIPLDQLADMIARVQESKVSVDRVEAFLREEETDKYVQLKKSKQASPHETRIGLESATLTWGTTQSDETSTQSEAFRLINCNVNFPIGKLSIIAGPTGSGKSSLLMALLGEMKLLEGTVHIPGGHSRQDLHQDPETGLTESVAYCAQQAWLVNATIKENILFALPFDKRRYEAVIAVCALERDLEILDAGDQTLVGEKGITLSGGQKQRISLARALYSNARHLMLDDCLSAVDSHTGKHIFERALMGDLMQNRTCLLVSHNVALTVPLASFVVVLENGKIASKGSPTEVMESGALGDEMTKSVPTSRVGSTVPSRTPTPPNEQEEESSHVSGDHSNLNGSASSPKKQRRSSKTFVDYRKETKATGSVKWRTMRMYLQAMGPWYYWLFAAAGFLAVQVGSVATNVWIRQWSNAYHSSTKSHKSRLHDLGLSPLQKHFPDGMHIQVPILATSGTDIQLMEHNSVDVGYYLGVYALIGLLYIGICLLRELVLFWGSIRASWSIHQKLLHNMFRATFRFFDSTPLGQLTNRFSKDISSIDQEVAPVAIGLLHSAASVVTIVILISVITPGFLIPGVFIALLYTATGLFYIRASRDLKRIESVQRSPLFQHFGETLSGVVTIRAYGDEARFIQDSNSRINTHNRPFIYLWATNRWLAIRVEFAGALVAFFSATFLILNVGNIDPGAAGLSLSYAITFTQNVFWLVRLYASNEQNMNSVERVQEYIDVEQERPAEIPEHKTASNWPSHGSVEFANYSTRYRKDLDPVLRNVTFKIEAGEKVGIVGRTGAGKSSLALALFRGLEAEEGQIILDDVDIGLIGLRDLREAITIVPQDPTLFTGTLRSNLDPFDLFTDEEIFTALRRVQLISSKSYNKNTTQEEHSSGSSSPTVPSNTSTLNGHGTVSSMPKSSSTEGTLSSTAPTLTRFASNPRGENANVFYNLSTPIAESGSNLSQGQRQLLCLARALLKAPKVLVMDEATASIDYATDSKIQMTLRELKGNTIITIAHRLQTIIDYDKVLVLDKGFVKEYAHPYELLRHQDGLFRSMCETNGEFENLLELAKKAWDSKRLVDVDT